MIALLKLVALVATLMHFLGPWGSLAAVGAVIAVYLGIRHFGERIFEGWINQQCQALGQALKNARVTVHSITPAPEPDPSVWRIGNDDDDDAFMDDLEASDMPEGDYEWFKIDVTIDPQRAPEADPACWDPCMVHVSKNDGHRTDALEFDADCIIAQLEIWMDGQFVVHQSGTAPGPERLRLYVGITPGVEDVRLTFFGQLLAELRVPSQLRVPAARV